jgi:hypothetical protein
MKSTILGLILVASVAACPRPLAAQFYSEVNVPLIGQETNSWCWAASGQMVMQYFGYYVPQCVQATFQFGQSMGVDCCTLPTPSVCISGGQVVISHYGFNYNQLGGTSWLTPAQIEDQIFWQAEPWIINPNGPGFGHVIVGVGYWNFTNISPKMFFIGINDPWPQNPSFNSQGQATGPVVGEFYLETYEAYAHGVWEGVAHTEGWDIYNIVPPPSSAVYVPPIHWPPISIPIRVTPDLVARVSQGDANPVQAAGAAWELLKNFVTHETATRLGFASEKSAASAVLAAPVEQFAIAQQKLRDWKTGQSPNEILEKASALFVPVQVEARTRASIRLMNDQGTWRLATFGSARLSQAWQEAQKSAGQFLVEIESLELAFAGRREGNQLLLTPLFNDGNLHLEAGHELRAEEILPALAKAATNYRPSVLTSKPR